MQEDVTLDRCGVQGKLARLFQESKRLEIAQSELTQQQLMLMEGVVSSVIVITDSEFESQVLKAEQPVLVYFWASWCGPCRLVAPAVASVADQYSDRLKVIKMEIDPNPETVKQYRVEGVPALLLFKNGEVLQSHEGAMTKQKLEAMIDAHLSAAM